MALEFSDFTPMLKEYYSPRRIELLTYKSCPTMKLLTKVTDWTGDNYVMPVWYEAAQAVGNDFTIAKANKADAEGRFTKWVLTRSKKYGFTSLDRLTMKASAGNARAFLSAYTAEVDGTFGQLGKDIAFNLFRTRACVRSTISAIGNGDGTNDRITLANRQDVVHFHVGMKLVASDSAGAAGATLRNSGDAYFVRRIDRTNGYIFMGSTMSAAVDVVTDGSWAANDWLHRHGEVTTASNTLGLAGFEEWIPDAAPGSTTFFGVNRSIDTDKLGGIRVDGSGLTIEDALIEAHMRVFEVGGDVEYFCMNPLRLGHLIRETQSKLTRDESASAKLGVETFTVRTAAGETKVYGDPYCQPDVIWGLNTETWKLVSTGTFPEIIDDDMRMLRESDADAYEVRMGGYGQLGCHEPGANCRIDL